MKISLVGITLICTLLGASDFIELYNAYTNGSRVVIEGRVSFFYYNIYKIDRSLIQ